MQTDDAGKEQMPNAERVVKRNICVRKLFTVKADMFAVITISVVVFVFALLHTLPVYAHSNNVNLRITQTINVKGVYSTPLFPVKYTLRAESAGAPLPVGCTGKACNFEIRGNSSEILSVSFTGAGEYVYTISQKKPKKDSGYSHDDSVYKVYVSVIHSSSGLSAKTSLRLQGSDYKPNSIHFINQFKPPANNRAIKKIKTGDNARLRIWIVLLAISILLLLFIILFRRRKWEHKNVMSKDKKNKKERSIY